MHVQSCCFACFFPFTLPSQSSLLKLPILGLQPRDKAAMLGVNTIEILLEKFT